MGTFDLLMSAIEEGKEQYGSYSALSRASGVSEANISRWRKGQQVPRLAEYVPILDAIGAQIVLPGQTVRDFVRVLQLTESDAYQHDAALKKGQNVPVPVLEYVSQNCRRQPSILFLPELLENIEVPISAAVLFLVNNDAMSPTLHENDLLLVDTRKKTVEDGTIYLVHVGPYFLARRLSKDIISGDLLLTADGPAAPLSIAAANLHTVEIIGKAVWAGKKL